MNISSISRVIIPLALLTGFANPVIADEGWQKRLLLTPSAAQQRMEREDRVYIYDGLHEETVDRALDTQFERVQNMMFVGVRHTSEDGDEYADDDCD